MIYDNDNYFENLTDKQKAKLQEKNSASIYYTFIDECEKYFNREQTGTLILAILHYAKCNGTEPLPEQLSKEIESDKALSLMFDTWKKRIAKATISWVNRRGGKAKELDTKTVNTPVGYRTLKGNKDNFPENFSDLPVEENMIDEFIEFANKNEWNKPFYDLYCEYLGID